MDKEINNFAIAYMLIGFFGLALFIFSNWRAKNQKTSGLVILIGPLIFAILPAVLFFSSIRWSEGTPYNMVDFYHYYTGSKYFKEFGYDNLYEYTVWAGSDLSPTLPAIFPYNQPVRDLRTGRITHEDIAGNILRRDFKPGMEEHRWRNFVKDIRIFHDIALRGGHVVAHWHSLFFEHGYNGTPFWTSMGSFLTNIHSPTEGYLSLLSLLDISMLCIGAYIVFHIFGIVPLLYAVGVFFTSRLWDQNMLILSFLRYDWFFAILLAILSLKDRSIANARFSGAMIALATSLRIFPVVFLVGTVVAMFFASWKREMRAFVISFVVSLLILSMIPTLQYGPKIWTDFSDRIQRHEELPFVTAVGVRTLLSFPYTPLLVSGDDSSFGRAASLWRSNRRHIEVYLQPVFLLSFMMALSLFILVVRRHPIPWIATILAPTLLLFLGETMNYYLVFLLFFVLLFKEMPIATYFLLLLVIGSCGVAMLPIETHYRDVVAWLNSLLLCGGVVMLYAFLCKLPNRWIRCEQTNPM